MNTEKSYLCPLFWQHHEEEAVLREELQRMKENGMAALLWRPDPIRIIWRKTGGRI